MFASLTKLSTVKKLLVFLASELVSVVNEGFVPPQYVHYVQITVFFLTSIGLYAARNAGPSVASATAAAATAAAAVTDGGTPTFDQLQAELDSMLPKHAADPALPAPVGPITQPLPTIPPAAPVAG